MRSTGSSVGWGDRWETKGKGRLLWGSCCKHARGWKGHKGVEKCVWGSARQCIRDSGFGLAMWHELCEKWLTTAGW